MILDRFRLDGQVAVVTGAGRGIGAGTATRPRRGRRRRPDLVAHRGPAQPGRREDRGARPPRGRRTGQPGEARPGRGPRADGVRRARPARRRGQQRRGHDPELLPRHHAGLPGGGVPLQRLHRARAHPGRGAADDEARRRPARSGRLGGQHLLGDQPARRARLPRLRHGQGSAVALDQAGGARPRPAHPGQRDRGRIGDDLRTRVRRLARGDQAGHGGGHAAEAHRRGRGHRRRRRLPEQPGRRLPDGQDPRDRRRARPAATSTSDSPTFKPQT